MTFKIIPAPEVTLAVSVLAPALQKFYSQQILPYLAEDPYPSSRSTLIVSYMATDLRPFYQYFDGIVPLFFQYRVFTPDVNGQPGLLWLAAAIPEAEI